MIGDKFYQSFTIACLLPPSLKNSLLTKDDIDAFDTLKHLSTSKKDGVVRA